jgi:histidinol-phosphate aminotransferase
MLCNAFAGPILYPVPTFVYYKLAAVARGLPVIEVPLGPRFELDEATLARAIVEHRPSVVFLALPNNPTGTLWRMDFALELAAAHRDTVIVSDEAYVAYSGRTSLPALDQHPNLVIMRTLSKVGLAGLRVGFTISAPAIADVLEKVRPPYNLSSLDQAAAVFALREAATWCLARAADVVEERVKLAAALAPYGDVFESEANLILVRFGAGRASTLWQGLADRGIVVRNFDTPAGGPLAGCLRITVGTVEENALLLAALAELA